jgi:uncharacterized protein (TIGR03086 family)
MDIQDHYARVADGFSTTLAGVRDWTARTPCDEWDADALARHVVDTTRRVLARLDGSEPPVLAADAPVVPAWQEARAQVESALADRADQEVDSWGRQVPFGQLVDTLLCADTLLHTWDLARATGQDDTLDLAAVSKAHAFLTPMGDAMRRPGGFGPEKPVEADASAQDRLLAFAGRQP